MQAVPRKTRHTACPEEVKHLVDAGKPMTIQCRVSAQDLQKHLQSIESLEYNFQSRGNQEVLLRKRDIRISISRDELKGIPGRREGKAHR